MTLRGCPAVALAVLTVGCPRSQMAATPPTDDPQPSPPASDSEPPPRDTTAVPTCGLGGEDLGGVGWIPRSATVAALLDVDDEAALRPALGALAEFARGPQHELPIAVAFALGQWDFQVPLILDTLDRAGFRPSQLGAVQLDDVGMAWVFGTTCDLDRAVATVEDRWGVDVRRTADGAIGTPTSGSDGSGFAFDVVFLPADRAVLVPAGRGGGFVRALHDAAPADASPGPGPSLSAIEAAPVRIAVAGPGLTAPGAEPAAAGIHRLRASPGGVHVDGRLSPPS